MTDLQVKYQALQVEKDKLAETKRLNDAQISKLASDVAKASADINKAEADTGRILAETGKISHEISLVDAQTEKYVQEAGLTAKDIEWYDKKTVSEIYNKYASGTGSVLKGISSLIPGL